MITQRYKEYPLWIAIYFPFCNINNCWNLIFTYRDTGNIIPIYTGKSNSNNFIRNTYGQGYQMRLKTETLFKQS